MSAIIHWQNPCKLPMSFRCIIAKTHKCLLFPEGFLEYVWKGFLSTFLSVLYLIDQKEVKKTSNLKFQRYCLRARTMLTWWNWCRCTKFWRTLLLKSLWPPITAPICFLDNLSWLKRKWATDSGVILTKPLSSSNFKPLSASRLNCLIAWKSFSLSLIRRACEVLSSRPSTTGQVSSSDFVDVKSSEFRPRKLSRLLRSTLLVSAVVVFVLLETSESMESVGRRIGLKSKICLIWGTRFCTKKHFEKMPCKKWMSTVHGIHLKLPVEPRFNSEELSLLLKFNRLKEFEFLLSRLPRSQAELKGVYGRILIFLFNPCVINTCWVCFWSSSWE